MAHQPTGVGQGPHRNGSVVGRHPAEFPACHNRRSRAQVSGSESGQQARRSSANDDKVSHFFSPCLQTKAAALPVRRVCQSSYNGVLHSPSMHRLPDDTFRSAPRPRPPRSCIESTCDVSGREPSRNFRSGRSPSFRRRVGTPPVRPFTAVRPTGAIRPTDASKAAVCYVRSTSNSGRPHRVNCGRCPAAWRTGQIRELGNGC